MRVVFMGTAGFAVPSLYKLAKRESIAAVVTAVDKPQGRGYKTTPSAVKKAAQELGLPVIAVEKLKDPAFIEQLRQIAPDIIIVIDFGMLLPKDVLAVPPRGTICLHPSLLPKYRGASPIEHALLNGDAVTGNSVFFVEETFDSGDILLQKQYEILPDDNNGTIREKLAVQGADLVLLTLDLMEGGNYKAKPQNTMDVSYSKKIEKEDGLINWKDTAVRNRNKIRAFTPKPGAFAFYKGKKLKITKSQVYDDISAGAAGEVLEIVKDKGFIVSCAGGGLLILEVHPESKNPMTAWNFVLGYRLAKGDKLGE